MKVEYNSVKYDFRSLEIIAVDISKLEWFVLNMFD
jgi:hypothetical protein